ncbi:MAG: hypothetical protein EXQ59_01785 [Acidobacteria bacterium]|nr:hypothetical protein [Acidobacteriota bacterium]
MRAVVVTLLLLACSTPVLAQPPVPARGFVVVNGGYELTSNDFADAGSSPENAEQARFTTDYTVNTGPAFDVAGGVAIWRRLGLGVGVERSSRATPVALTGSVPHPFFFNRDRSVSGTVTGLTREELAVHVKATVVAPIGTRVQVLLFGGPSFFLVTQGVITDFTWTEAYPYDVATFNTARPTSAKASKVGFHAGADVAVFFTRQIGVGGTVQFAGASVALTAAGGESLDAQAGGIKAGGGLRLRF